MTMKSNDKTTKSVFVALIGCPNVGKSTLLNALVGQKVAIVSDKPQTTRNKIMGVKTLGDTQIVFVDTPGAHRPRTRLGDLMVKSIGDAVSGVDAVILVTESGREINAEERNLLERCSKQELPLLLVINKVDTLADKSLLLVLIDKWQKEFNFNTIIPLSAITGDGVNVLIEEISHFAFESPHFFPDNMVSDQPERVIVQEIIREKILQLLHDEVPHGIAVVVERMNERKRANKTIIDIEANIYCERENHKGILIGKRGSMLQQIGTIARLELEQIFDTKVNLQCWIKVKEDWRNRQGLLGGFGFK